MTFLLASREESGAPIDVYSPRSPLGSAISGKKVGETATYNLPNGRGRDGRDPGGGPLRRDVSPLGAAVARRPAGPPATAAGPSRARLALGAGSGRLADELRLGGATARRAVRPRSGISLMNQASTNTSDRGGTAQMNTPSIACAMATKTSCRISGGQLVDRGRVELAACRCAGARRAAGRLSDSVSRRAKIAPNSDTPIEPPICWKNIRELLATPMSFGSTLFCAISVVICIRKPMPMPSTAK